MSLAKAGVIFKLLSVTTNIGIEIWVDGAGLNAVARRINCRMIRPTHINVDHPIHVIGV